jgi:acetyl esterase/lipase
VSTSEDILTLPAPPADARIAYGPDPLQFGDLRLPTATGGGDSGPFPLVILIHGGYWRNRYDLAYFGHAAAALTAEGLATWNIEYRRMGDAGGGWPGTLLDVAAATDYARALAAAHPLDLNRVVALGHSAGGQLAVWLAARHRLAPESGVAMADPLPLRAIVALAGVLDLRRAWELHLSDDAVRGFLGGTPDQHPARYAAASPAALLPTGIRQTLIHGTQDDSVPFAISRDYADAARAAGDPVELITLPGAGHFEIVDPRTDEWRTVPRVVRAALA